MCEVLAAASSGFYDWLARDPSTKQVKLDQLKTAMGGIFKEIETKLWNAQDAEGPHRYGV